MIQYCFSVVYFAIEAWFGMLSIPSSSSLNTRLCLASINYAQLGGHMLRALPRGVKPMKQLWLHGKLVVDHCPTLDIFSLKPTPATLAKLMC